MKLKQTFRVLQYTGTAERLTRQAEGNYVKGFRSLGMSLDPLSIKETIFEAGESFNITLLDGSVLQYRSSKIR